MVMALTDKQKREFKKMFSQPGIYKFNYQVYRQSDYTKTLKVEISNKEIQSEYHVGRVSEDYIFSYSMNIEKITNNGLKVYTYDLLGNRTSDTVKFEFMSNIEKVEENEEF